MKRKTLVLPTVVGILTPLMAACGTTVTGGGDGGTITVGTTDQFTVSKEAPAPLDPAYAYDTATWNLLRQTLQTLMTLPHGGGDPVPEAAQSCDFTDSGSSHYACTLRDDLKFANGHDVTAKDVKYSIERVRAINAETGAAALFSNIAGIDTQGDKKVVFNLKAPDATFPFKLATPPAGIVDPETYDKTSLRRGFKLDGSGPYKMSAQVKDDVLVKATFTRNGRYKGQLKPKNDKVELRSFPGDPDAMGKALEDGGIDLMTRTMSPEQVKKYANDVSTDYNFVESAGLEIRYLAFNTDAAPVKNKAVRQAMAQVVDRGALATGAYGTASEPLYSLIPAGITGHTNAFFNTYGEPSRDKAESTLRDAGITTPVKLTLYYTTDHYGSGTKKEFEILQKQLNDSKLFDIDIKGVKWNDFRDRELDGDYAAYGMGFFPDFPDPDNFTAAFLDADNFLNSPYANDTVRNNLIPASRKEADRLGAADDFSQVQDIVAKDVPVLPLWQGKQYVVAHDEIQGVEWTLDSSSNLQLWELSRGKSG
ncbi:ABC transporter substrate-binding protein [Streptomyces sp. NPDC050560]|uniref:ABC transporter substrate-binding protein n=1 Tax=Streptomyces sp. NPDC050560 TaxID=3365630 RepID=UPI003788EE14